VDELTKHVQMGCNEILKSGKCILCDKPPVVAGIVMADGSPQTRKALGTPDGKDMHRFLFYGLCAVCAQDSSSSKKVLQAIMHKIAQGLIRPGDQPQPSSTKRITPLTPQKPKGGPLEDGEMIIV
jgi:hypothetical protein